jgi:hypothetical protein
MPVAHPRQLLHRVSLQQADPLWLSPAYQRNSAYIAVHMYKGMPFKDYFWRVRTCCWTWVDARTGESCIPAPQSRPRDPRWDDFQALRRQQDPGGVSLNGYLKRLMVEEG